MGQIQIYIISVGPVFWPENKMWSSGWCILLSASGLGPIWVEEIVSKVGTGVYRRSPGCCRLFRPCRRFTNPGGYQRHRAPSLLPSEKRSLVIKVHPGNPTALTVTDIKGKDPTND